MLNISQEQFFLFETQRYEVIRIGLLTSNRDIDDIESQVLCRA